METKHIHENIIAITPQWVEARDKAKRGGHHDGRLNLEEKDCMALLNRLLDKLIDNRKPNIGNTAVLACDQTTGEAIYNHPDIPGLENLKV